eukprot:scpid93474/ scgid17029/ 
MRCCPDYTAHPATASGVLWSDRAISRSLHCTALVTRSIADLTQRNTPLISISAGSVPGTTMTSFMTSSITLSVYHHNHYRGWWHCTTAYGMAGNRRFVSGIPGQVAVWYIFLTVVLLLILCIYTSGGALRLLRLGIGTGVRTA